MSGPKGSSFGWGMRLLPPERRAAMYALYGLCRELDDIADDPALSADEKLARLNQWRIEIEALYDGRPTRPQSLALLPAVRRFGLERAEIEALIDGMEQDARGPIKAPSRDELRLYCRRVAGTATGAGSQLGWIGGGWRGPGRSRSATHRAPRAGRRHNRYGR